MAGEGNGKWAGWEQFVGEGMAGPSSPMLHLGSRFGLKKGLRKEPSIVHGRQTLSVPYWSPHSKPPCLLLTVLSYRNGHIPSFDYSKDFTLSLHSIYKTISLHFNILKLASKPLTSHPTGWLVCLPQGSAPPPFLCLNLGFPLLSLNYERFAPCSLRHQTLG